MDNCGDGIRLEITAQGSRFRVQGSGFKGSEVMVAGLWPQVSGNRLKTRYEKGLVCKGGNKK